MSDKISPSQSRTIQVIAFDYGRTLYDREKDDFFPDVKETLLKLSARYELAIVSFSRPSEVEERLSKLSGIGITELFRSITFVDSPTKKDDEYARLLETMNIEPQQLAIVDDYVIRGIAWGNKHGAKTIWYQNGKFAESLPTDETGYPSHTIKKFSELLDYL